MQMLLTAERVLRYNANKDFMEGIVMGIFSDKLNILLQNNEEKCGKYNDLAKAIGVTRQTVYAYTKGTTPPAETLVKIANYFHVSVDSLLGNQALSSESSEQEQILLTCSYINLSKDAVTLLHDLDKFDGLLLSTLIESGDIQNLLTALKDSIVSLEQFKLFYGNTETSDQMDATVQFRFQKLASEIYESSQKAAKTKLKCELKQEIEKQKQRLIDAAIEARTRLDLMIAKEGIEQ
jgi:transcriptional regulator with XRE-family HTH domain